MSTRNFKTFADAMRARFAELFNEDLFVVAIGRDEIWETYLEAFPPGTNPIFRERTEHDCSCCRHFIRSVGGVVAIQNGALSSVWDLSDLPEPYQSVADAMAMYVRGLEIRDVFLTSESKQGTAQNHEQTESGKILTWDHFSVEVPDQFITRDCVAQRGEARTVRQLLLRGIEELDPGAVEIVADLIEQDALYRGEEHARAVSEFQQIQARALALGNRRNRELLAWSMLRSPAARFRNTVIGTLVQDLSNGTDLERAVKSFETKVAPQNYKRPTALITKKMVENAMETIRELDLENALERRHARLEDVSVESVLFVDNHVRGRMRGGVEDLLMEEVRHAPLDEKHAEEVGIDEFISRVLPESSSIELYLDNGKLGNFVSMTAPAHDDAGELFKWDNNFAWSYEGNVADSIKERVKRAGGRVEGVSLRTSLAWYNYDDLDIHVVEPNGNEIYYGNKCSKLDVDMNVSPDTREAVENVRWVGRLRDGTYKVFINQYTKRESVDVGFEVEIEHDGGFETFSYEKAMRNKANVPVAEIVVEGGRVRAVKPSKQVIGGASPREQWGLMTQNLVRVNAIVLSPNHWNGRAIGNRHWFFILDGCRNPLPTRGIYNEFLSAKLEKHRKVFEILGDKVKCLPADEQLSGIGFSSTRRDKVMVVASGTDTSRTYAVRF